jgi:hypothetical protein
MLETPGLEKMDDKDYPNENEFQCTDCGDIFTKDKEHMGYDGATRCRKCWIQYIEDIN